MRVAGESCPPRQGVNVGSRICKSSPGQGTARGRIGSGVVDSGVRTVKRLESAVGGEARRVDRREHQWLRHSRGDVRSPEALTVGAPPAPARRDRSHEHFVRRLGRRQRRWRSDPRVSASAPGSGRRRAMPTQRRPSQLLTPFPGLGAIRGSGLSVDARGPPKVGASLALLNAARRRSLVRPNWAAETSACAWKQVCATPAGRLKHAWRVLARGVRSAAVGDGKRLATRATQVSRSRRRLPYSRRSGYRLIEGPRMAPVPGPAGPRDPAGAAIETPRRRWPMEVSTSLVIMGVASAVIVGCQPLPCRLVVGAVGVDLAPGSWACNDIRG